MDAAQRKLRVQLRAQAKQLGDGESQTKRSAYEIKHIVEKVAYDQWHRLLFGRYLLENNLLISPEHQVSVTLDDCEELAPALGLKDAWAVAARFAATELPEIFRTDDPAGAVELAVNDRKPLIALVTGLPAAIFTASDSLGWTYQFWQTDRKAEINKAGNKIGADELPSVTQLFTEDYMVDFLLDNTLGAWRAGKVLAANPKLAESAQSEDELRQAVALPGCPWKYLRFIKGKDGKWTPAAGTFDGWPKSARELTCLDPCMGSGHFVVAMFERLVALRLADEKLDEAEAVAAVIRDNLFGLEIDPRCTQIGAFNLALAAWRRVGHCKLPAMNLACSGLAPNTREADWLAIAGGNEKLRNGMVRLYRLFENAPVLGSLINPRAGEGDLFVAAFHELQPLLEKALAQESRDDTAHEMAVTARGLAKAAEILAAQFTLVATNVPFLGREKQCEILEEHVDRYYLAGKSDLACAMQMRCLELCERTGFVATVSPQYWLFLGRYENFRRKILSTSCFGVLAKLGTGAFETISGEVVNTCLTIYARAFHQNSTFVSIDVGSAKGASGKKLELCSCGYDVLLQKDQQGNPNAVIGYKSDPTKKLLSEYCYCFQGLATSDNAQFVFQFWELPEIANGWETFQMAPADSEKIIGGLSWVIFWQNGQGKYARHAASLKSEGRLGGWKSGHEAWGKNGVAVNRMSNLPVALYDGSMFDCNVAVVVPNNKKDLPWIWSFLRSDNYKKEVRRLTQKTSVTNLTLIKIPVDKNEQVELETLNEVKPLAHTDDPTQWLFNGHPAGADQPLHVAVARLLGYQWPRQTGSSFPDCPALGPDGLETLADDDGIVCLAPINREQPAAQRLRALLVQALGKYDERALIAAASAKPGKSTTLEDWLRDEFFEQHCALFHHRPFVWHIWDGRKDGFHALLNCHMLDNAKLQKLAYSYLGDWIRQQAEDAKADKPGAAERQGAALALQLELAGILVGEAPQDIFVRWKPISKQAQGWQPDNNDGVRMNIRPFMYAADVGRAGAGILRSKPNIKWEKDRGTEPERSRAEFPWLWCAAEPDAAGLKPGKAHVGNRWNDVHLTLAGKQQAKA